MESRRQTVFTYLTIASATTCIIMLGRLDRMQRNMSVPRFRLPSQNISTVTSKLRLPPKNISTITSNKRLLLGLPPQNISTVTSKLRPPRKNISTITSNQKSLLRLSPHNLSTVISYQRPQFRLPLQKMSTIISHQSIVEDYDILHQPRIRFNDAYKNPCWIGKSWNGPITDDRLHCLPYFYLLGVKKSGTTDFYARIRRHPEFANPGWKESQWLSRKRFGFRVRRRKTHAYNYTSVAFYVTMFNKAAKSIKAKREDTDKKPYYRKITGDAAPSNLHMHTNWNTLPDNEGLTEPKYTNFHYLKHLSPNMKIVLIFRDPVTRFFSDFNHELRFRKRNYRSVPEAFHNQAIILTKTYEDCFRVYTMRRCIYNNTLKQELKHKGVILFESFVAGFYGFYIRELYQIFQPTKILPVLMSDYMETMNTTLTRVFDFLEMRKCSPREWQRILNMEIRYQGKGTTSMLEKTINLLKRFYRPFNKQLANLLKDKRYLFE